MRNHRLFQPLRRGLNATRIVALSFGILILLGTVLLLLPAMSRSGQSPGWLTALFTATSATCVTGLSLVDTWTQWSGAGQVVLLVLIQLGGLGFMTAYTLVLLLLRQRIGLSQRLLMASALNLNSVNGVVRLMQHALRGTIFIEGIGAILLAFRFVPQFGLGPGLWRSIFHAVSAFCNAGFDLMGVQDGAYSLMTYAKDPYVLLVHMALIVMGGLGFFVWEDLWQHRRRLSKLSLYSKLVLLMSGGLIVMGGLYFFLAEGCNPLTLGAMTGGDRVVNALFQSVTLRTAGFATFPQGGLQDSSLVMSILLMLVGGSSGSTAGGIKTVTVAILLLSLRAGLRGREQVTLRDRSIPAEKVRAATNLVLTVGLLFLASSMAISLLEEPTYLLVAFEAASAMATVGLSADLTSALGGASHLLLIALMYLGRVGILSFSLAFLTRRRGEAKVKFPSFDVMIG